MRKELIYYSILTLIIAGLLFFETNIIGFNSENITKVIKISNWEKLDIDLACNIYVSVGDEQKVVFEGPARYIERVETHLENGILKISAKEVSFFSQLFRGNSADIESLNVYIKITDADQLITPRRGNLISNETALFMEFEKSNYLSLNFNLKTIIQLIGNQIGLIRIR